MKKKVLILFGGTSTEHDVSLVSAKNVIENIDKNKFELTLVGIDTDGSWYLMPEQSYLVGSGQVGTLQLDLSGAYHVLVDFAKKGLVVDGDEPRTITPDVIFPILHGLGGEDGTVQGLSQLLGVPVVGCEVLGSSICMDKDVTKRLLSQQGITNAPFMTFHENDSVDIDMVVDTLGLPLFVKSANGGSSVGVSKVKTREQLLPALADSFKYDRKVIVEAAIVGRELEIAIMGNQQPVVSDVMGEIVPAAEEFYSYDAKYINETGVRLVAPADVSKEILSEAKDIARRVYQCLECRGMARVDFFLTEEGQLVVNEVNTIPGFTGISMYPKLFALSGVEYSEIITKLIHFALEK